MLDNCETEADEEDHTEAPHVRTADYCKRVLSHVSLMCFYYQPKKASEQPCYNGEPVRHFDFDFGDMLVLCLNVVPETRGKRNRKGEKEGHVSRNPL